MEFFLIDSAVHKGVRRIQSRYSEPLIVLAVSAPNSTLWENTKATSTGMNEHRDDLDPSHLEIDTISVLFVRKTHTDSYEIIRWEG
uniref:Uncharacterized protein n=1 Tax=Leersia perrieri TaxID=77586 RepID=A0A0D9WDY3_9ORYZ